MNIESYIIHFGYVVILVATFFAGEAILVLAGFLAHRGYLSFSLVILVAFAGSLTSDQLYYFIGRQKGFIYGVRSITPFLVGVSRVSPLKYFILNAVGALVWALALTSLGYVFGHAAELILDDIKKYEFIMMGIILLAGLGAWMVHFRAREKEKI